MSAELRRSGVSGCCRAVRLAALTIAILALPGSPPATADGSGVQVGWARSFGYLGTFAKGATTPLKIKVMGGGPGRVLVTAGYDADLAIVSPDGRATRRWRQVDPAPASGQISSVAMADDGTVFVADSVDGGRLQRYTASGALIADPATSVRVTYVQRMPGNRLAFIGPDGMGIMAVDGRVQALWSRIIAPFAVVSGSTLLQAFDGYFWRFDLTGRYLSRFGRGIGDGPGQLHSAGMESLGIDADGGVVVPDPDHKTLLRYDQRGSYAGRCASPPVSQRNVPTYPAVVANLADGTTVVADAYRKDLLAYGFARRPRIYCGEDALHPQLRGMSIPSRSFRAAPSARSKRRGTTLELATSASTRVRLTWTYGRRSSHRRALSWRLTGPGVHSRRLSGWVGRHRLRGPVTLEARASGKALRVRLDVR